MGELAPLAFALTTVPAICTCIAALRANANNRNAAIYVRGSLVTDVLNVYAAVFVPHSGQNLAPGVSCAPHSAQNFLSWSL